MVNREVFVPWPHSLTMYLRDCDDDCNHYNDYDDHNDQWSMLSKHCLPHVWRIGQEVPSPAPVNRCWRICAEAEISWWLQFYLLNIAFLKLWWSWWSENLQERVRFAPGLALTVGGSFDKAGTVIRYCDQAQGSIHSKNEKVCGTVFSVKNNCGKSAQIRASFLGHLE